MELIFLDEDFEDLYVLDTFKSLIWTERFWKCGDFEVTCSPNFINLLTDTKYFRLGGIPQETSVRMRLESQSVNSDPKEGDLLLIQGRDLSSILDQRIIWDPTIISGNLQTGIEDLLDASIITPLDINRTISNFNFLTSTDPAITALTTDTQFQGELLLVAIMELCREKGIGFRTSWDATTNDFWFELYAGVDRSYDQTANDTVAFTTALENLINAAYVESSLPEKNVCLVAGEAGVGNVKTTIEVGSGIGLARKETYLEASVNRNTPAGEMTDAEYLDALEGKGLEELAKREYLTAFDGEVDTTMYSYGDAFGMGDILQIADNYGHSGKSRVVEMIYAKDSEGSRMYPTFEHVE